MSVRQIFCATCLAAALAPWGASAAPAHALRRDAGDPRYDVRKIPAALREGASAVVREHVVTLDVSDEESASETVREVVTVLKREGRSYGILDLDYDRFRKIKDLDGALLDQLGDEIRTLGGDDIVDESAIGGGELYADARVKKVHLYHDAYPYTVVFTYRIVRDGYVSWPSWESQPSDDPVEYSKFEVILPYTERLRYWTRDTTARPRVTEAGKGRTSYVWEARNLPALSDEQMAEDIEQRTTVVYVAPEHFKYADIPGDMRSWQDLARWEGSMYTGKDVLPEAAVRDVHAAIAGAHGTREKIDTLYRYLQARTRYVAVELGIGGFQPYDARFVQEKGYGDCKALSNYMAALLREAGVPAYPAIISAGGHRSQTIEAFPSDMFNHVIVCAPQPGDTVWLECTSESKPPGHLGTFTENRPALLLTPGGGALVRTPASKARDNMCAWSGRVEIAAEGTARAALTTVRTGDQSDPARDELLSGSPEEKQDWLLREIEVAGTVLHSHTEEGLRSPNGTITIGLTVEMPVLASHTGSRLFFQPNLTNRNFEPPRDVKGRRSPRRLAYPYIDTDSLLYIIPRGFTCEALPAPLKLATAFAKYATSVRALGDTAVMYTRTIELDQAVIPGQAYNELAAFYRAVARADKAQVVLAKKE